MVFRRICIKIELCYWSTNMAALTSLVIDFFGISRSISNSNRGVYTITADVQMCMCLYVKNTIMVPIKVPIKKKSYLVVSVFKVGTCRTPFLKASTDCFSVTLGSVSKGIFKWSTSTRSEVFFILKHLDATKFVFLSVFTFIDQRRFVETFGQNHCPKLKKDHFWLNCSKFTNWTKQSKVTCTKDNMYLFQFCFFDITIN